jgi:aminocarboxymuconate-semialdehyde decarboxylase
MSTEPRSRQTVYDLHAHCAVPAVAPLIADAAGLRSERAQQATGMGQGSVAYNTQVGPSWYRQLVDTQSRLATMDRQGIDVQVVSIAPNEFHYWADESTSSTIVETINASIAATTAEHPDRLLGLATLSMQFPELAADQLRRAVGELGLRGAIIGASVVGRDYSDDRFEPVWAEAEARGATLFIHPWGCSLGERLARAYLFNTVGNPTETTLALSHLIFGGVLDRHPDLKVCAAHGGGYLPAYAGRTDHAWRQRTDVQTCVHPPSSYLRRMWFDTIVHDPRQLRHLVEVVGASQVVVGTDYPFDMGVDDPLGFVASVPDLTDGERTAILGTNAERLLGIG